MSKKILKKKRFLLDYELFIECDDLSHILYHCNSNVTHMVYDSHPSIPEAHTYNSCISSFVSLNLSNLKVCAYVFNDESYK